MSWYSRTGVLARTAEVKILHKSVWDTLAAQDIQQLILPLANSPLTPSIKGAWITTAGVLMSERLKETCFCRTKNKVLCTVRFTLPFRSRHLTNCYWSSGGRWVLIQGAVHTDEGGTREAKCLVSYHKVIMTWTGHMMCMFHLAGFWEDCEAKALAIHCHYRPSGFLWQRKVVNSHFLAALQFGWLYSCFLKFLLHPTNQFWPFADSPNLLLLLVVE